MAIRTSAEISERGGALLQKYFPALFLEALSTRLNGRVLLGQKMRAVEHGNKIGNRFFTYGISVNVPVLVENSQVDTPTLYDAWRPLFDGSDLTSGELNQGLVQVGSYGVTEWIYNRLYHNQPFSFEWKYEISYRGHPPSRELTVCPKDFKVLEGLDGILRQEYWFVGNLRFHEPTFPGIRMEPCDRAIVFNTGEGSSPARSGEYFVREGGVMRTGLVPTIFADHSVVPISYTSAELKEIRT